MGPRDSSSQRMTSPAAHRRTCGAQQCTDLIHSESLINRTKGVPPSLSGSDLPIPQRWSRFGWDTALVNTANFERVRVRVQAFDEKYLSMGSILEPLPPPSAGVTEPVVIAAVFPDELIMRVEVSFEVGLATASQAVVTPIAELSSVTPMTMKKRRDGVTDGGYAGKVVANAPATEDGFFLVPKVVE